MLFLAKLHIAHAVVIDREPGVSIQLVLPPEDDALPEPLLFQNADQTTPCSIRLKFCFNA